RGFPQYLRGAHWEGHRIHDLLDRVHLVDARATAADLRSSGLRGQRLDGHNQVPSGLYIVNHDLLSAKARPTRLLLRQLWTTRWDLIMADEPHHSARGNQPAYIFAPNKTLRDYEQGIAGGKFGHILALTATPFELTPKEMVNLLALVRADP